MRKKIKSIAVVVVGVAVLMACGGTEEGASQSDEVLTESATAISATAEPEAELEPTEVPAAAEPAPTEAPALDEEPETPEPETPEPETPERGLLPVGVSTLPGLYAHDFADAEMWLDVPESGTDVQMIVVVKNEWQVTMTMLDDERLPDESTPGFSIALADSDATVDSVVEAIRESDAGRFSFETTTGVFAGADATIITRVSNLEDGDELPADPIISLSTGNESALFHLYVVDWMLESYVFERDGRVMVVSYEWSPSQGERQMVLAQAAPLIESIVLRDMS